MFVSMVPGLSEYARMLSFPNLLAIPVEGRFPVKVIYSVVFTWNIVMKRDVKLRLLRCKV